MGDTNTTAPGNAEDNPPAATQPAETTATTQPVEAAATPQPVTSQPAAPKAPADDDDEKKDEGNWFTKNMKSMGMGLLGSLLALALGVENPLIALLIGAVVASVASFLGMDGEHGMFGSYLGQGKGKDGPGTSKMRTIHKDGSQLPEQAVALKNGVIVAEGTNVLSEEALKEADMVVFGEFTGQGPSRKFEIQEIAKRGADGKFLKKVSGELATENVSAQHISMAVKDNVVNFASDDSKSALTAAAGQKSNAAATPPANILNDLAASGTAIVTPPSTPVNESQKTGGGVGIGTDGRPRSTGPGGQTVPDIFTAIEGGPKV